MFSNPGGTIKVLATIVLILGLVFSLMLCISLVVEENAPYGAAVIVFCMGAIVSGLTFILMYSFGLMFDEIKRIREKLESIQIAAVLQNASTQPEAPMKDTPDDTEEQDAPLIPLTREQRRDGWACPHCRFINSADRSKCAFCGKAK